MTTLSRLERFEHRTEWPLAAVAIVFLGVGYGDLSPVTFMGRVAAVALMVGGITVVGTVTATLASWIVQRVAEEDTATEAVTGAPIEELKQEIRRLSNLVTRDREPAYGEGREGS